MERTTDHAHTFQNYYNRPIIIVTNIILKTFMFKNNLHVRIRMLIT